MNTLKKIIGILLLLILITIVIIFLNPNLINQKVKAPDTTSNSNTSTKTIIATSPTIKDNKTIEIGPKIPTEFDTVMSKFDMSQITDKEFAGVNGAQESTYPIGIDTKKVHFYVVNSTFQMSDSAKTEFAFFKNVLDNNQQLDATGYSRILNVFRQPDQIGGYQKELQKDINISKPEGTQKIRAMYTYDGVQFPSPPTITIMGQAGNDYFVIEYRLQDIDHVKLYKNANQTCGVTDGTVTECTKLEYAKLITPITTLEYLTSKANEALNLFKF